ncbi:uncharacterized protein LOC129892073 [Solanum dulcamara]|uniref:uncharacterized protein LOC129892073 n=1 Tax=Solanum dulcamara TaxID=45834 RepID=UPI0024861B59|nr:uncharacterized protein LOC129892073 [Solanum dulcamara]
MGRFRFVFFYFMLLVILVIQAEAGKFPNTTSLTYSRKMMVQRDLLIADPPAEKSSIEGENEIGKGPSSSIVEAPESSETEHHHSDKSVAGGGVIIGGLVTALFATVYCYIRVTRKRSDGVQNL